MDTQTAYETMRAHFNAPGARLAKNGSDTIVPSCSYRTETGAKCAVGCLIPDSMYDESLEGKNVFALLALVPEVRGYLWNVDKNFLRHAQRLHDMHARNAVLLVELLDLLAKAHGLTTPEQTWL